MSQMESLPADRQLRLSHADEDRPRGGTFRLLSSLYRGKQDVGDEMKFHRPWQRL